MHLVVIAPGPGVVYLHLNVSKFNWNDLKGQREKQKTIICTQT